MECMHHRKGKEIHRVFLVNSFASLREQWEAKLKNASAKGTKLL